MPKLRQIGCSCIGDWLIVATASAFVAMLSLFLYPYTFVVLFLHFVAMLTFVHMRNPVVERQMTSSQTARMLIVLLVANDLFAIVLTDIARRDFAYPVVRAAVEFVMNLSVIDAYRCDHVISGKGCLEYNTFVAPNLTAQFVFIFAFFHKICKLTSHALMDGRYPTGRRRLFGLAIVGLFVHAVYSAHYDNVISPNSNSLHPVVDAVYSFMKNGQSVFISTTTLWSGTVVVLPLMIVIMFESVVRCRLQEGE